MCVESLKCSREYCKICNDCMNPINHPILELEMAHQFSNDDEKCNYCVKNGCKNTKVCHGCSACSKLF